MKVPSRDFHHPFKPYDIQDDLMNAIYDCITEGKIGVFESPTGTGKSLSLICASLTWLRDAQEKLLQVPTTVEGESDEPSWVIEHARVQIRDSVIEQKSKLEARLRQIRAKELRQKQCYKKSEPQSKRLKAGGNGSTLKNNDETRFELDEYDSEDGDTKAKPSPVEVMDRGLSHASMQLMEKLGLMFTTSPEDENLLHSDELKFYFCSRTHSQLTQFVQELRRVDFPSASWAAEIDIPSSDGTGTPVVKHIALGSRKNLCINPKVSTLGSASAMNERCLELQKPDTPDDHKCPFIPNYENQTLVNDFVDHTLAKVRDIEDLGALGKRIGICPYYASRATIPPAEVIVSAKLN